MPRPLLSMFVDPEPSDDELLFARQLGVDCVYTWIKTQQRTYEYLARLRERVESYGLRLYNVGNMDVAKNDKIHLALPGRDQAIADALADLALQLRSGPPVKPQTPPHQRPA